MEDQIRRNLGIGSAPLGTGLVGQHIVKTRVLSKYLKMDLMLALFPSDEGTRRFHQAEVAHGVTRRDSDWRRQHIELAKMGGDAYIHLDKFILYAHPGHTTATWLPLHTRRHIVASGHLARLVTHPMEFELVRIILHFGAHRQ